MGVTCVNGKYKVNDFIEEHNHPLHLAATVHMLASQRKITTIQAHEIDLAEDAGLQQKASFEWMSRHVGGRANLGYTRLDAKNYIQSKRQRSMVYGEVGCLLRYFQQQLSENPSFYHAYQIDMEEQITNVFWADARMLIDYAYFGDVVTLDTTYSTNRDHRPLAIFSGFNHFRGAVIFGAALLYDETAESFKWLLETFLEAHKQKKPLTIFTDQDQAMAKAIQEVWPETSHGLCTWHLMQNVGKHLGNLMKDGSRFLTVFKKCMFDYDDEAQFEVAWSNLLSQYNMNENTWLKATYKIKEKWTACFMKKSFTLGMRSTQLSESLNADVKSCTKPDLDITQFFKHFERVVDDKRYNELRCEFEARQKIPRLKLGNSPLLRQLAQTYTMPIFDHFQEEYDLCAVAYIKHRNEFQDLFEYVVSLVDKGGEWRVLFNPNNKSVSCSCRKFETMGILCCHTLKVYDMMDVKQLPEQYILKRWTKEARSGVLHDMKGKEVEADIRLQSTQRYRQLCPMLIKLATEASDCPEAFSLVHQAVFNLSKQVAELRSRQQVPNNDSGAIIASPMDYVTQAKGFKRRDGKRMKRRPKSCLEHQHKRRKTTTNVTCSQTQQSMDNQIQYEVSCSAPPVPYTCSAPLACPLTDKSEFSFTRLLMAPFDCPISSLEALEFNQDISNDSQSKPYQHNDAVESCNRIRQQNED